MSKPALRVDESAKPSTSRSWWLDKAFQQGQRTQGQAKAIARMRVSGVSVPGEGRVIWLNGKG